MNVAQTELRVEQTSTGTGHRVVGKPNTEPSALREAILENMTDNTSLTGLLVRSFHHF